MFNDTQSIAVLALAVPIYNMEQEKRFVHVSTVTLRKSVATETSLLLYIEKVLCSLQFGAFLHQLFFLPK